LISAGILVAFSMTNCCLVLLRCQSYQPGLLEQLLALYNALCFLSAMLWSHTWSYLPFQTLAALCSTVAAVLSFYYLVRDCPRTAHFGGSILSEGEFINERHITHDAAVDDNNESMATASSGTGIATEGYFVTPLVPYLPCLGMAVNWYLIAQLDITGILLLFVYLGIAAVVYMFRCARNSVGHIRNWNLGDYHTVHTNTRATSTFADNTDSFDDGDRHPNGFYPGGEHELSRVCTNAVLSTTSSEHSRQHILRTNSL
jgi:C-terminus of AA_permease